MILCHASEEETWWSGRMSIVFVPFPFLFWFPEHAALQGFPPPVSGVPLFKYRENWTFLHQKDSAAVFSFPSLFLWRVLCPPYSLFVVFCPGAHAVDPAQAGPPWGLSPLYFLLNPPPRQAAATAVRAAQNFAPPPQWGHMDPFQIPSHVSPPKVFFLSCQIIQMI